MYCTKCGASIPDDAIACTQCGCATKNYHPEQMHCQRGAVRRGSDRGDQSRSIDLWKIIGGAFIMLIGAKWFCSGIVSGRVWVLVIGIIALICASSLIAWGVVNQRNPAREKNDTESHVTK